MGYTKKFLSGELYSAQDVNSVFAALTTQGISLFKSDDDNILISLDEAISSFVSPGLDFYNRDSCKVKFESSTNKFIIQQGNAWFIDGSFLTVDINGIDISDKVNEIRKGTTNDIYVYFKRDVSVNDILIMVDTSTTNYQDEACVPLAIIKNDNSIVDLRKISKSKVAPCTNNIYDSGQKDIEFTITSNDKNGRKIVDIESPLLNYAEYMHIASTIVPIQKVDSSTLEYTSKKTDLATVGIAVRESDTAYEIWFRWESGSSASFVFLKYMIF